MIHVNGALKYRAKRKMDKYIKNWAISEQKWMKYEIKVKKLDNLLNNAQYNVNDNVWKYKEKRKKEKVSKQ